MTREAQKSIFWPTVNVWLIVFIGLIVEGILWEFLIYLLPNLNDFFFALLNVSFTILIVFYSLKLGAKYFLSKIVIPAEKVVAISAITTSTFILFQLAIFVKSYFSDSIILPELGLSTFIRALVVDVSLFVIIYYWLKKTA